MDKKTRDGVAQAIITEFVEHELPLLERTLREVQAGQTLGAGEIEMLGARLGQIREWHSVAYKFPDHKPVLAQAIDTIDQITTLAMANERKRGH